MTTQMNKDELRYVPLDILDMDVLRQEGKQPTLRGTALRYNSSTELFPGFTEEFAPGAFTEFLASGERVFSAYNHDLNRILGNTKSGTMRITDSRSTLRYEVDPPNSAADIVEGVERGDITGLSVRFYDPEEEIRMLRDGSIHRRITKARLREISPTPIPQYKDTDLGVARSIEQAHQNPMIEYNNRLILVKAQARLQELR